MKTTTELSSQISNLKQVMGKLADAVSEEIENIKKCVTYEIDNRIAPVSYRVEQF